MEAVNYKSPYYTGKAFRMGAGVQIFEANQAAYENGLVVVGANGPTVGLAGGYTQGGGHGSLASAYGLAADQVLEWEVVTATGELLTASPTQNSDLYWALSGGGGGTYGVVFSVTSKAYADQRIPAANLTFTNDGSNPDAYYGAVNNFIANLPRIVDAGAVSVWLLSNTTFQMAPTTAPPGMTQAELQDLLQPVLTYMQQRNFTYKYFIDEFPSYKDSYNAMTPQTNVSDIQIGGRLIPRSLVQSNLTTLATTLRNISEHDTSISGLSFNVSLRSGNIPNSVNPVWRSALFHAVLAIPWNNTDWEANLASQNRITNELLPQLEILTPGGGAYINEGNFQQPDFQHVFYGRNYDKLRAIKQKYDSDGMFYGLTAVGSEAWGEASDGRLCRV